MSDVTGDASEDATDGEPEPDADRQDDGEHDASSDSDSDSDPDPLEGVDPTEHPVILFDGVCTLCHRGVRFTVRNDPAGRFRFAPLSSPPGQALCREYGLPTEDHDSMVLVDAEGAHRKSEAVLRVARGLAFPWRLARFFEIIPRGLRDRAYDLVAATRYDVFGQRDACTVPEPEVRERFTERALE